VAIQGFCVRARPGRPPALDRHGPAALAMTGNGTSLRGGVAAPPELSLRGGKADAAIQGFTAAPDQAARLPWFATGLPALAMTGNGTSLRGGVAAPPELSLRGGKADAAIQGFTAAPGQAAHLPWFATGLRPSR
jgi:hypothetical protein